MLLDITIGAVSVLNILFPNVTIFIPFCFAFSTSSCAMPPSGPIIIAIFKFGFDNFFNDSISFFNLFSFSFSYAKMFSYYEKE